MCVCLSVCMHACTYTYACVCTGPDASFTSQAVAGFDGSSVAPNELGSTLPADRHWMCTCR